MLKIIKERLGLIIAIVLALSTFGAAISPISPWAMKEKIDTIAMRLDQKIVNDNINTWQERIWLLEDRYQGKNIPKSVREEIRRLRKQIKDAEEQLRRKG